MDDLYIFAAIVDAKSLNQAAQILNITQPALSRKIKKLEYRYGIQLFDRKGKRLLLTSAGKLCYDYAVQVRELEKRLLLRINEHRTDPAGSLTVGASLTTLQSTLPDLITLLSQSFPKSDIKARTGKTHEMVSLVRDHQVDLGLVASLVDQPDLYCIPLFDDHLCLVLPTGHPLAGSHALSISSLHNLPMILFSRGTWYRVLMDDLFHRYSIVPDVKMEIDSFEAIIRLVSTSQSATLLPQSYLRNPLLIDNSIIVRQIPELEQAKRTTTLIFDPAAKHPVFTEPFIEKIKTHLQSSHRGKEPN